MEISRRNERRGIIQFPAVYAAQLRYSACADTGDAMNCHVTFMAPAQLASEVRKSCVHSSPEGWEIMYRVWLRLSGKLDLLDGSLTTHRIFWEAKEHTGK